MSLERAIHELWSADHALVQLVPAARLFTGAAAGSPALPYVVLSRLGTRPAVRTSAGRRLDEAAVRFRICADGLEQARQVEAAIARRFDRRDFDRADVACLHIRRVHDGAAIQIDGTWRLLVDYLALHEPAIGA
jgi:hypothetical protein